MAMGLKTPERWAEYWALFLLIVGFLFAVKTENPVFLYIIALCFGLIFGRFLWKYKKSMKWSVFTIILGFLVGYLLGAQTGDRNIIIVVFFIGLIVSFYVHNNNILRSAEY